MQIRLLSIKITNFKGIRSLNIPFTPSTSIYGENAAGKTSIFDAFTWCLFGKDSNDRKDFEVKTLDGNNEVIPNIEHEVETTLQVEQQVITLKRVLREKWTKKRGSTETEFTGNETLYFWNDVPCQQKEYQEKVSGLVDEGLFKLITNPLYFNVSLKWQDRREVLFSMADKVLDSDVFDSITTDKNSAHVQQVIAILNHTKTATEYKKEITAKKKKLKDELALIPARIDEVDKSKPLPVDYSAVQTQIDSHRGALAAIEEKKESATKAQAAQNKVILDKQSELNQLKSKLQQLNFDASATTKSKLNKLQSEVQELRYAEQSAKNVLESLNADIVRYNQSISTLERENADLRDKWNNANQQIFAMEEDKTICPSCKRKLDDADIHNITETLQANFNEAKAKKLDEITKSGGDNKVRIEKLQKSIEDCHDTISSTQSKINSIATDLELKAQEFDQIASAKIEPTDEMIALENQIATFVIPTAEEIDFSELNSSKFNIQSDIDSLNKMLGTKDQIVAADNRIAELQRMESEYSQQLADLESHEFVLDAFNKNKIVLMEQAVNSKFENVRFKLFEKQINGGELEICEVLVNTNGAWVPFSNGNKAGQMNAGLDIINTLCKHHNVYAPIFIDNRESVNELIATKSQIINLIVSTDKSLKIN
jgi:DNA repair protein SbcC/Rad50